VINIVIPMAGLGTRFTNAGINIPKPLVVVNGKTLIEHAVESLKIEGNYIFITRKYDDPTYNEQLTQILRKIQPNCTEIMLEKDQLGAADAALHAKEYTDNDDELIITNCDQILEWDSNKFLKYIKENKADGVVVLYKSTSIKDSYAEIIDNKISKIKEKDLISDNALIGVHYWKNGKDFVKSAEALLLSSLGLQKECYISETYNFLIKEGKSILPYAIPNNEYICLGTPEYVEIYLAKVKEFYSNKPKTIFCDIDGTILKHVHRFSDISSSDSEILPGVREKFNEWDSKNYKIILTTARKESARNLTERQLSDIGLPWDCLLMGITSGQRVLINDKLLESDIDRAIAVNLITNDGFLKEEVKRI
jgi:NDP-sugar pyrophosphorylase family protein